LGDDYVNIKLKDHHFYHKEVEKTLDFKEFDAQTNYMRIPTFSGNWIAKLDSFYRVNHPKIISKQNLIIDVRNNGGGSDAAAFQLLDYIYSKPFFSDQVDLYVTKENIRKSIEWYEENKSDTINFDKEFMSEILAEIERMKTAPLGSFISRFERQEIVLDSVSKLPSKIYILQNRYCASTCESLLFWAKESDKVIRLGENSGGYVGYGEISNVKTPIYNFDLGCTMTRFVNQRSYEQTGIPPDIYLDYQSDWLEQVKKYLK
jgi:C-terminal processing protease CtpA/Prc